MVLCIYHKLNAFIHGKNPEVGTNKLFNDLSKVTELVRGKVCTL